MLHALADNGAHMVVGKGVEYGFSLPAALYQLVPLQDIELVGDGRLGHVQRRRQVADADLRLKQDEKNSNPCGVAEHLEKLRELKMRFEDYRSIFYRYYSQLLNDA